MAIKIIFKAPPEILTKPQAQEPKQNWPFPPGPKPDPSPASAQEQAAPPAEDSISLMAMASTPAVEDNPPWEAPHVNYDIFHALHDFTEGKYPKKKLIFVKKSGPDAWRVIGWDAETKRASLEHIHNAIKIKPVLSQRESANYTPFWE